MPNSNDEGVHRLSDILVEEVSLVDRPANQRPFLLVKRVGGNMNALQSNGRGGFTRVRKADDTDEDTEKGKKPPFGGNKAPPFGAGGKPGSDDDKDKSKKSETDTMNDADDDADKAKAKAKKDGSFFENESEKKKAKKALLIECIAKSIAMLGKAAEDLSEDDDEEKAKKAIAAAQQELGGVVKTSGRSEALKAMDSLQGILSTFLEGKGGPKGHDATAGDPQKAPAGFSEKNPSDAMMGTPGTIKALQKAITESVDLIGEMKTTIEKQAKRIKELAAAPPERNGGSVERVGKKANTEVEWPLDMNDIGKNVEKGLSFADD